VQIYTPKSKCEDDIEAELYDIIKKILEEGGKGETDTIIMGD
jgi:uncharacterized membrane-anchored protein